jgi:hypothetical protein
MKYNVILFECQLSLSGEILHLLLKGPQLVTNDI